MADHRVFGRENANFGQLRLTTHCQFLKADRVPLVRSQFQIPGKKRMAFGAKYSSVKRTGWQAVTEHIHSSASITSKAASEGCCDCARTPATCRAAGESGGCSLAANLFIRGDKRHVRRQHQTLARTMRTGFSGAGSREEREITQEIERLLEMSRFPPPRSLRESYRVDWWAATRRGRVLR